MRGDRRAACASDGRDAGRPRHAREVYGGPDTLTINGTLRGEDVSAAFSRGNGCEIERFDRFADVLAALYDGYRGGTSVDVN